jgi:membrane-associated phospholipid phosphatase
VEGLKFLSAVSVAEFDAGIAVWREKAEHMVARPESLYERLSGKKILLPRETPAHPSYPSGHSGFSGAMVELVERYFGKDTLLILNAPEDLAAPGAVVKFSTPAELLGRINQSRVDAGFHYPVDVEAGAELGRCVGGKVFDYFENMGRN